jgi:hypothetical protein
MAPLPRHGPALTKVDCIRTDEGVALYVVRDDTTNAGPANGGLRLPDYGSEVRALGDGLRLARQMRRKHTLYRTGFSGAKLIASADPTTVDRQVLLRGVAAVLNRHAGQLYTGCDMNTTTDDMARLTLLSPYVLAAVGSAVDASLATAHGVDCDCCWQPHRRPSADSGSPRQPRGYDFPGNRGDCGARFPRRGAADVVPGLRKGNCGNRRLDT